VFDVIHEINLFTRNVGKKKKLSIRCVFAITIVTQDIFENFWFIIIIILLLYYTLKHVGFHYNNSL
jgi:capsule polysaccharide export protein KpsE/RkpR